MHVFISNFMQVADLETLGVFLSLLSAISSTRNELLFCSVAPSMERILRHAASMRPLAEVQIPVAPQPSCNTTWSRPPQGTFKIYFDAAVANLGDAGFGFIDRNYHGEVLAATCGARGPVLSPVVAEALSMRWALGLASRSWFSPD